MRVLLVEDTADLAEAIRRALAHLGHAVDWIADGGEADEVLALQTYDLVILDLTLPGMDGLDVLSHYRARGGDAPVLILTARDGVESRVAGLDRGADDYLVKPFELIELEARVRALLRRNAVQKTSRIAIGGLVFDQVARRMELAGEPLELPRREAALLEILLLRAGQVVSKDVIAGQLFGFDDEAGPNAIEIYVHRLRKRLKHTGPEIKTVRGLGYLIDG